MKTSKLILTLILVTLSFIKCKKEDPETDLLVGKWKLVDLVNIEKKEYYMTSELEISVDNSYKNKDAAGENIVSGKWNYFNDKDSLLLTLGLFEDVPVNYSIRKNNMDSLILEEHYILDNKDATLEYKYKRIE